MKSQHTHDFQLVSPHPFGAILTYKCSSCPTTWAEKRESNAERMARREGVLGIHPRATGSTE